MCGLKKMMSHCQAKSHVDNAKVQEMPDAQFWHVGQGLKPVYGEP